MIRWEDTLNLGEFPMDVFGPGLEEVNINLAIEFLPEVTGFGEFSKHLTTIDAVNIPLTFEEQLDNWDLIIS